MSSIMKAEDSEMADIPPPVPAAAPVSKQTEESRKRTLETDPSNGKVEPLKKKAVADNANGAKVKIADFTVRNYPEHFLLPRGPGTKAERVKVCDRIVPILFPTPQDFQLHKMITGSKSQTMRGELYELDTSLQLKPLWQQYLKDKNVNKFKEAAAKAIIDHMAKRAEKDVRKTSEDLALKVYAWESKNPDELVSLSSSLFSKLVCRVYLAMSMRMTEFPRVDRGFVKNHGTFKPTTEADRDLVVGLVQEVEIDGKHFKAWTKDELRPKTVTVRAVSTGGGVEIFEEIGLEMVAEAILKNKDNGLHETSCKYVDGGKHTDSQGVSNSYVDLEVDPTAWDILKSKEGNLRVYMEDWKVFYGQTPFSNQLEFPKERADSSETLEPTAME